MKLPMVPVVDPAAMRARELPLWPPLLATRGPGAVSARHAHHAMHLIVSLDGELRARVGAARRWTRAAGIVTAPSVAHEIDATGSDVLLVFLDPESEAGAALAPTVRPGCRLITSDERRALAPELPPLAIMAEGGVAWTREVVAVLGGTPGPAPRAIHPRVRRLLRLLQDMPADADTSLEALAGAIKLSPGRLMHAFTESIGLPLRPYLAWRRLQRAAGAVVSGMPLADAAHAAGFADAAHMTRTFRQMFGTPPSALRPR
jgi:AraC-like DNA-binding protein